MAINNFEDHMYLITDNEREFVKSIIKATERNKLLWNMNDSCRSYFTITQNNKISITGSDFGGNANLVLKIEVIDGCDLRFVTELAAVLVDGKMKKGTSIENATQSEKDYVLFTSLYTIAFYNAINGSEKSKKAVIPKLTKRINSML